MFCPTCGNPTPDDAKFCPKCGTNFAEFAPQEASVSEETSTTEGASTASTASTAEAAIETLKKGASAAATLAKEKGVPAATAAVEAMKKGASNVATVAREKGAPAAAAAAEAVKKGASTAAAMAKEKGVPATASAAVEEAKKRNLLWPAIIVIVAVLAAVLLLPRACSSASLPFGIGGGGAKGSAIKFNIDTSGAEKAVTNLLDAAKKGDTETIKKLYLGDVNDLAIPSLATSVVTFNSNNLPDAYLAAFEIYESTSATAKKGQEQLRKTMLSFTHKIERTTPFGNLLAGDCNAASVRVAINLPQTHDVEILAMQAVNDARTWDLIMQFVKYAITDADTEDVLKDLPKGLYDQLTSHVDDYYKTLMANLPSVKRMDKTISINVVKTNDGWKVAPLSLANQQYIWGEASVKYNKQQKWIQKETKFDMYSYVSDSKLEKPISIAPAGHQETKLANARSIKVTDGTNNAKSGVTIKATDVKVGTDALGRLAITGTFENITNKETYGMVTLAVEVSGSLIAADKQGNSRPVTFVSATPGVGALTSSEGNTGRLGAARVVANLAPHEKRPFTLYPSEFSTDSGRFAFNNQPMVDGKPVYELGNFSMTVMSGPMGDDAIKVDVAATGGKQLSYELDNSLQVTLTSVYRAANAKGVIIRGTVKNTGRETVHGVMPVFVAMEGGVPAEGTETNGPIALAPESYEMFALSKNYSGQSAQIDELAPGQEAEFAIDGIYSYGGWFDGIALRDVKVNWE